MRAKILRRWPLAAGAALLLASPPVGAQDAASQPAAAGGQPRVITGELDTITGSVLALLGIGSGTALGATLIDQGKSDAATAGAASPPSRAPGRP